MRASSYEYFCPYCGDWISDVVHDQDHHNSVETPDDRRDARVRVDGVVYGDENEYLEKTRSMKKLERIKSALCADLDTYSDEEICWGITIAIRDEDGNVYGFETGPLSTVDEAYGLVVEAQEPWNLYYEYQELFHD